MIYYFLPILPIVIRFMFAIIFKQSLKDSLSEEESDRESIRSYILALSGFSFTALIGLVVLEPNVKQNIELSIFYIFISFLLYFFSLNLQGYKKLRWHEILSDALIETASLCLVLTVLSLLFVSSLSSLFSHVVSILGIGIWLIDFIIRLNLQYNFLEIKENKNVEK